MGAFLRRIDAFQKAHPWLALPVAVVKKFGDDQAAQLAALIAYYGFFSLFPLLLVFVAVLGFVLQGDPDARDGPRLRAQPVPGRRRPAADQGR